MSEIKGHRKLSEKEVRNINDVKDMESLLLTMIEMLASVEETDKRWLMIGKTHIEQGFMAIVRSIAKPSYK